MFATTKELYEGPEIGAIRPPSEAESLLVKVTRNCPWNKCTFCRLYKGESFSVRPKEHILKDLEILKFCIDMLKESSEYNNKNMILQSILKEQYGSIGETIYYWAYSWYRHGMESIFLQDANTMVLKPDDMIEIIKDIKTKFKEVKRITSYGRSHTIARISDEDLLRLSEAGLNRIHIGMETGCDEVLSLIKKGVDKQTHILAGQKVKKANIELSEYFMPGLGGHEYSKENAFETADCINEINPDFIRIRTLAVPKSTELYKDYENKTFTRTNDIKMVEEILLFINSLSGITSTIKSDHILNLLPEVEGTLPKDKDKMVRVLEWFLTLSENEKTIFRVGRRTAIMNYKDDLYNPIKRERVLNIIDDYNISDENVDTIIDILIERFI